MQDKVKGIIGEVDLQLGETNNTSRSHEQSHNITISVSNKKRRKRKNKKGPVKEFLNPAIPKVENLISKTFQAKLATAAVSSATVISAKALDSIAQCLTNSIETYNEILESNQNDMGKPTPKVVVPSGGTKESEKKIDSKITANKLGKLVSNQDELKQKIEIVNKSEETEVQEKTREDIKAEREAKKRAKQASKLNKSTSQPTTSSETNTTNLPLEQMIEAVKISNEKKPVLSKAERRAIQEAQRAAKASKLNSQNVKSPKTVDVSNTKSSKPTEIKQQSQNLIESSIKCDKQILIPKTKECKVKLFNHLEFSQKEQNCFVNNHQIHPTIVRLGEQYAQRTIVGSNARCIAFLNALRTVIQEYETPAKKEFARSLEAAIKNCVDHLQKCRPLAVSISNAYKYIKYVLTQLPTDQPESELKEHLIHFIDTYIENQIGKAAQAISISVQEKISHGDVILTFGCSSLINYIFEEAHRRGVDFRVVVVDSRPFSEGQELLRRLVSKEISCTYVLINAVGFIMPEVSKVLLGAHALLANGYVMARTGTAQVALVARSFNVPVLVCCETHKFCERVQTDAIVYNELGNPDDLVIDSNCRLSNWQLQNKLSPLNLNYDITPPELVTAVVTEVAILPCTSVPVILRIKPTEIGY